MSETNGRASLASEISVPEEVIELVHLKTNSGEPVKVKVYPVNPLMAGRAGMSLPGAVPKAVAGATASETNDQRNLAVMLELAPAIIEDCTALAGANGKDVVPAFYFGAEKPGSIPGRVLHAEDLSLLVATAMRLAGYGSEVAESATFRRRKRSGSSVGA
jgi:hypothetical protein